MRQITIDSIKAFMNAEKFKRDNTEVEVLPNVTVLKLFGNEIAYRYNDPERTLSITNCEWKTATTKERLNGLPRVNIYQRNKKWYLNNKCDDHKVLRLPTFILRFEFILAFNNCMNHIVKLVKVDPRLTTHGINQIGAPTR